MKSKPKPAKKETRGSLVKKSHGLMREIVLDRDGGCVCPRPERGHTPVRQAGHLIKSTKGKVRFDLWNVHEQCSACNGRHVRYEHYYVGWFIEKFGKDEYLRLTSEADGVGLKTYELRELLAQFKAIREKQLIKQLAGENWRPYFTQQEILSGLWREK